MGCNRQPPLWMSALDMGMLLLPPVIKIISQSCTFPTPHYLGISNLERRLDHVSMGSRDALIKLLSLINCSELYLYR